MTLKVNFPKGSCAICGSTWGNYWKDVQGENLFFCCQLCYLEFQNMIDEVKKRTSWPLIDEFIIKGDYRGRAVTAKYKNDSFDFLITFGSTGLVRDFKKL
ncbi:MAG: TA0938 family protein [archaeon]|nr:TA0938 family protein [archaeon]